jgi:GNAT superfamily N-acetyltransferase
MLDPTGKSQPVVRDVLLRDGSTLRMQAPTPADYDDIKKFYDGLSQESRYMRFHGFGRTDTAARAAAEAGGVDRVWLIARHDRPVVAVAGFDGLREPRAAEVSFAVADGFKRRGTGTRMLEQLAENRGAAWDSALRCGGDGCQPGDAAGVRARRLRCAAPGFVW